MTPQRPGRAAGGIHTVRRVIMLLLLAILVSVAASGTVGLLGMVLDPHVVLEDSNFLLAQAIASVVIAAPLGGVAYWLTRRWLLTRDDRHSVLWPVYLAVFGTIALIIGLSALLAAGADAIGGSWRPDSFSLGIVWIAVWAWHAWMWRTPSHAPTRLVDVGPALGALVGICFAISGSIGTLSNIFSPALLGAAETLVGAGSWWLPVVQQLLWAAGGAIVWWWHWWSHGIRRSPAPFARFTLVVVSGFVAVGVTLGGLASAAYTLLALFLGIDGSEFAMARESAPLLEQLATSAAAAFTGALVWALHRSPLAEAETAVRWSARLVASGVALAFAASGLGVVVNATLASFGDSIAGGERSLLFGGLSALLVGGIAWWLLWRPLDGETRDASGWASFGGRRAYLVIIFGVSALVAVVTLLVIAYGILQSVIGGPWSSSIVEAIRQPLGLLTATALVAVYHFVIWRRSTPAAPPQVAPARIGHITLVAAGDTDAVVAGLREATGATVTVWRSRDEMSPPVAEQVVAALSESHGDHVLVVATGERVEVVHVESADHTG